VTIAAPVAWMLLGVLIHNTLMAAVFVAVSAYYTSREP